MFSEILQAITIALDKLTLNPLKYGLNLDQLESIENYVDDKFNTYLLAKKFEYDMLHQEVSDVQEIIGNADEVLVFFF